jgi:hypothetical protein
MVLGDRHRRTVIGWDEASRDWHATMSDTEADYRDDLGDMDGIGERPLPDFLPPPDRLVRRDDTAKVTLSLSQASVAFFRSQAERQGVPYQRTTPALVDAHTRRRG